MKDTECRQQVQCIETNLESEAMFRRDSDNALHKELNALNTRISKTEKQVVLLNTIIDRHSNEVLNTRVKLDKHVDEQVGALG